MNKFVIAMCLATVGLAACGPTGGDNGVPPRGQTYHLPEVEQRVKGLRPGTPLAVAAKRLGQPAIKDGNPDGIAVWFYLPTRRGGFEILADKLRVVFTAGTYSSHSHSPTHALDYTYNP